MIRILHGTIHSLQTVKNSRASSPSYQQNLILNFLFCPPFLFKRPTRQGGESVSYSLLQPTTTSSCNFSPTENITNSDRVSSKLFLTVAKRKPGLLRLHRNVKHWRNSCQHVLLLIYLLTTQTQTDRTNVTCKQVTDWSKNTSRVVLRFWHPAKDVSGKANKSHFDSFVAYFHIEINAE
jgi:hypothetical protein